MTFTFGRRLHHHHHHQNEEEDFVEDFDNSFKIEDELRRERVEEMMDKIQNEVKDIRNEIGSEEEEDEQGINDEPEEKEDNKKAVGISSKPNQDPEERKRASYEEYLTKLSRVESLDDLKREFNIKEDSFSYKRNAGGYLTDPGCRPFETTEKINYTSHNSRIYPQCISVQRCGGEGCSCQSPEKTCVVTATRAKQGQAYVFDLDNNFTGFHTVDYVDHTSCSCKCKRKATDCKSNQNYNPTTCLCDCPSSAQTKCSDKKQWSRYACGCVCSQKNPTCPPNHIWDTEKCECKIVIQPTCSTGSFNSTTCKCQ